MTSKRKVAANRRNGRKSRGPASAAGKKIASRNALRHGLTAVAHRHIPSSEIDRISKALCGDEKDPELIEAALKIAETEMAVQAVRQQKLAAVERLHDVTAIALTKGDNSLVVGQARAMQFWLVSRVIEEQVPKLMEKYKDEMAPPFPNTVNGSPEFPWLEPADGMVPIRLKALLEPDDSSGAQPRSLNEVKMEIEERDEHEALTEALSDLIKLDRYERRALSRQLHAARKFMNTKLIKRLNDERRAGAVQS